MTGSRGKPVWEEFRILCEQWTIYARYSPRLARREQARRFIDTIGEVKEWLKEF